MTDNTLPDIQLTRRDFRRLDQLTATHAKAESLRAIDFLVNELSRARVVDSDRIASDVVTMHSEILFRDEDTGRERTVTLVYPSEHTAHEGALSVLTPLGAALIGLAEGQTISFETSDGRSRRVSVVRVLHQPEANGRAEEPHAAAAAR